MGSRPRPSYRNKVFSLFRSCDNGGQAWTRATLWHPLAIYRQKNREPIVSMEFVVRVSTVLP